MNHGALFNGIGGFQLAAHWMGWTNVWHCEIDKFCNKVVKQHFPESICYEDIKQFDAREWKGKIDIISGGFPCQPFSQAGKRKGTDDDRYLWPEMLRIIGEVQPRYIVGENVGGLVNWDRGLVFEQVQADLEAQGYESAAFILPACAVNAPHRRDRIWFIAYTKSAGQLREKQLENNKENCRDRRGFNIDKICEVSQQDEYGNVANTNSNERCERRMHEAGQQEAERYAGTFDSRYDRGTWENFPTQSPVRYGNDGFSFGLVDITFSKWRVESIKALGNAIVPQIAFQIFKAINKTINHDHTI